VAHIRQSRPDAGLGYQAKALKTVQVVPSSRSGPIRAATRPVIMKKREIPARVIMKKREIPARVIMKKRGAPIRAATRPASQPCSRGEERLS